MEKFKISKKKKVYKTTQSNNQKIGEMGEKIACEYLVKNSFQVLERNHKKPWGELDVVAKNSDRAIVFIEVKTMAQFGKKGFKAAKTPALLRGWGGLDPEQQMTSGKIKRFKKAAVLYAGENQEIIDDKAGWRMDVITIILGKNFLEDKSDYELKHYENII